MDPWVLSNSNGSSSCNWFTTISTGINLQEETAGTLTKILQKDLYSRKVRCSASSQESRWSNSSDIFLFLDTDGTRWVTCRFHLYDGLRGTKKSRQSFLSQPYIMWISGGKNEGRLLAFIVKWTSNMVLPIQSSCTCSIKSSFNGIWKGSRGCTQMILTGSKIKWITPCYTAQWCWRMGEKKRHVAKIPARDLHSSNSKKRPWATQPLTHCPGQWAGSASRCPLWSRSL